MLTFASIRRKLRILFAALSMIASCIGQAYSAELLVIEQPHCPYCERFNAEIAPAYPRTAEGKRAPLIRVQLNEPWPAPYSKIKPATFTPTFILVENGEEVDRILGYPGDEFFWFLLNELLDKLPQ